MMIQIRRGWNPNQGATGLAIVKFTIQRNGMLTDVTSPKTRQALETLGKTCTKCHDVFR